MQELRIPSPKACKATKQEQWVWKRLCLGEIANFNEAEGYGGTLDPKEPDHWPKNRILRPNFLEKILLQEPYRNALTRLGVQIVGAWFAEPLDLSFANVYHTLFLGNSRFECSVNFSHLRTPYSVSLNGSNFRGPLNMNGMRVKGHLFMRAKAEFAEVDLNAAKIEGQLGMTRSTFRGPLNMNSMQVKDSLYMSEKSEFAEVNLNGAKIEGQLSMIGSTFNGPLSMCDIHVEGPLLMHEKSKFAEVHLRNAEIEGQLNMRGSTFRGPLNMNGMRVKGHLLMHEKSKFAEVHLRNAEIEGQLSMIGSTFSGPLSMNGMRVKGSLLMREKAEFAGVDLGNAEIEGQLSMIGSTFSGPLSMNSIRVKGNLFMREKAEFAKIDLTAAKIDGQLDMTGSTFSGPLSMESLQADNGLLMRDSVVGNSILLVSGKIGGDLDLSSARLPSLDLTGTQVGGVLCLGREQAGATKWEKDAQLVLRNTEVGALQDLGSSKDFPDAWPDTVELDDFTYARFGGYTWVERSDMAKREVSWFKKWLEKQKSYSPQPYEYLASVLRKAGYKDKATAILYAGKRREHRETTSIFSRTCLTWWWLTFQRLFIGYGYRNFQVLIWVGIFCVLGMFMLYFSDQLVHQIEQRKIVLKYLGMAYSLDMLLPIIELHKPHYEIVLDGWVRVYFYLHKIFGYVLASFLIAGLSGLTKR